MTTNSITQSLNRKVVERHLTGKKPVSLVYSVADHPWTKAAPDAAAVRIAMTAGVAGKHEGLLEDVISEQKLDSDAPNISYDQQTGFIQPDLRIGPSLTSSSKLRSNQGISANGMLLSGAAFLVSPAEAEALGVHRREGLNGRIKPYYRGKALYDGWRNEHVIDLYDLPEERVRADFPEVYQRLYEQVRPARIGNIKSYRERLWWLFGENNPTYRTALRGLTRYIATVETAKHRLFQFIAGNFLHDHMVIGIATEDASLLSILSSSIHTHWALQQGGTLEDRPRYNKSLIFDPFPFPDPDDALKVQLRAAGEELDAFRKARQAEHPRLTLTQMYNVREAIRAGRALTPERRGSRTRA